MLKKNSILIVALLLLVAGIAFPVYYIVSGGGYRDFTERTTATVSNVVQTNVAVDENETDEYEGTITYKVGDKEYKIEDFKLDQYYDEGAEIELAYAPDAPGEPALAASVNNSWVMIPVGIICIIIAVVLILKRLRGRA